MLLLGRESGEQRLPQPGVEERLEPVALQPSRHRLVGPPPLGPLGRVVDAGRRADQHEPPHELGHAEGEVQAVAPAHRVAEVRGRPALVGDEAGPGAQSGGDLGRAPVAGGVDPDDLVVGGEVVGHRPPAAPGLGEAVDQHDAGPGAVSLRPQHPARLPSVPPGTAQATFAATLVDEWVRGGVRHAVVCPGSRSTPLALALAADGRLTVHVHHDERSGGFLALGIGLATGIPAVVLTTSGTAAVELHPAVVEASYGRVPLLACTADRPPELHQVGAPQTVDQAHLYGRAVRWFSDPGVADEAAAGTWRSLAARALLEATGSPAGPVHLNLPFRDPLVADPGPLPDGRADGGPWHVRLGGAAAEPAPVDHLTGTERGVIVAGGRGADAASVAALADATGWPVLADPRSGCRVPGSVATADALVRVAPFADAHRPEVVVRLGEPPASKVLGQWLAASGARQVAVDADGTWFDPDRTAAAVVTADPSTWCRTVAARGGPGPGRWASSWTAAEAAAQEAIGRTLAAHPEVTEPGVARRVVEAMPDGSTLVVSSSMPVRDVEWYGPPRTGLRVLANRGANGIDGVVSTAVGVAAAGGQTALLIGDVALLHDANGLLGLADRGLDLTIVVVDNRGGGIFSFLPQAGSLGTDRFERLFGTPHDVDPAALAAVHGLAALRAHDADGVAAALAATVRTEGTQVVVAETDRAANVSVHDELHAAVAAALGG